MKYFKLTLTIFITLFFTACSTKVQDDMTQSTNSDVSHLLNKLIEKEKEINELTKQLEECRQSKN